MPIPDDELFESIRELLSYLERMSVLLSDPATTSMRIVLNPEKMVVKEAQRAYTYLNLYGYPVDSVFCNRVFPQELTDGYFEIWKASQAENLELVRECFHPLPIFEIPFFDQEVTGMPMLERMATAIYGDDVARDAAGDPTQQYYAGKPQDIFRENGHYVLSIPLPLVEREQFHLHRSVFDELVVRIGNWKRNIALPLGLAKLDIEGAQYAEDRLNIYFANNAGAEPITPEALETNTWRNLRTRLLGNQGR